MKLKDVADRLGGICVRGVRRLVQRGELPAPVKVGGRSCLFESDVQTYLERLKRGRGR
ncbi:helix-turn-helix transcriptional regulator [Phycisphaerales bacterium AB-hyl4]|uniref:Helix-turn-helix transcriptional regulator n=1 Tax=Natronomicrosphaera hydrolytica TaxID=3242702 RepID=A0ABV4UA42_9BACT